MDPLALPESLLARFRTVSFERLERLEAVWLALTHGGAAPGAEEEMFRDLHTLKGDARVVGFTDVATLCQRLEDLLAAARSRHYRVHDDVDIVVNMGMQFVGMLLRKKGTSPRAGIDLEGFLKQIEEVLAEWLRRQSTGVPTVVGSQGPLHIRLAEPTDSVSTGARNRLSVVATSVYLEHLRATSGAARSRLRDIWRLLAREIATLDAVPLGPILQRHVTAATELATEIGKAVAIERQTQDAAIGVELMDAVSTALLHALRNAVDHGIEPPAVRSAAGKPTIGTVVVRISSGEDGVEIVVQDDGGGVDLERVRTRAIERKLLAPDEPASEERLLSLLFEPGFSTRDHVSTVSGRGVGLDAVRTAVVRVGGSVHLKARPGAGTTLTIRVPITSKTIDVHLFRAPRTSMLFAVPATWTAALAADAAGCLDLSDMLALPSSASVVAPRVVRFTQGRTTVYLAALGEPEAARAIRLCSTPAEEAIEVVDAGRGEAILLRPEALSAPTRDAP